MVLVLNLLLELGSVWVGWCVMVGEQRGSVAVGHRDAGEMRRFVAETQ